MIFGTERLKKQQKNKTKEIDRKMDPCFSYCENAHFL